MSNDDLEDAVSDSESDERRKRRKTNPEVVRVDTNKKVGDIRNVVSEVRTSINVNEITQRQEQVVTVADEVEVEAKAHEASEQNVLREGVSPIELEYFVSNLEDEENGTWPEEDLMLAAAKEEDRKTRQEEVAKCNRKFWAEEVLMKSVLDKVDGRIKARRCVTSILGDIVGNVSKVRFRMNLKRNHVQECIRQTSGGDEKDVGSNLGHTTTTRSRKRMK